MQPNAASRRPVRFPAVARLAFLLTLGGALLSHPSLSPAGPDDGRVILIDPVSGGGQAASTAQVTIESASSVLAGSPVLVTLRLEESGVPVTGSVRLRVDLGGSCVFRGDALEGTLLEGAGTSSGLLELHRGRAQVLVRDPVVETVTIVAREVSGAGGLIAPGQKLVRLLDAGADDDTDGIANLGEFERATDPFATDSDQDGASDAEDNCPAVANVDQADTLHAGGAGDVCDDPDGDGVTDDTDNCPDLSNPGQEDLDRDGSGDACAGSPLGAPAAPTVVLPFQVTDAAFDPARPYVYVSDKAGKKVSFVNLTTGTVEKQFTFDLMPESLAVTPDGARLFVALLTREHSSFWWDEDGHEGYIASINLATQVKDRQFRIVEDPYDLVATNTGYLAVTSGSGQWTYVRVFNAVSGALTGTGNYSIYEKSRAALLPSGSALYVADATGNGLLRFDVNAAGALTYRWTAPYDGSYHRVNGEIWPSPSGALLFSRGGDVFTTGSNSSTDMRFLASMAAGTVESVVADATRMVNFTAEGPGLRYYNSTTYYEIGIQALAGTPSFLSLQGDLLYALIRGSAQTTLLTIPHPVLNGGSNTAPTARLTVTPATGATTSTDIRFDASTSSDAEDAAGALRFRWDVDNDGVWDAPFTIDPLLTKRFPTAGTRVIRVQVKDSLGLVGETTESVNVAFEPDPGQPGPSNQPFALPFGVTDAVFDPVRPYLYVSVQATKKIYFVNLATGFVEKQFSFDLMPEALAITPDGSRLFAALLTRDHSYYWWDEDGHEGYIASFDLATQVKDRQFHIVEDPFDLAPTNDGRLVVSSGSGQWTFIRAFDAVTGALKGSVGSVFQSARLTLHPSGSIVYGATTSLSPSDIFRMDLPPGGGIAFRWESPYHGDHRMDGNVWPSPLGDLLFTRGGDVYTVGTTATTDMRYVQGLSAGYIQDLAFDAARRLIVAAEGSALRYYNLTSRFEIGSQPLPVAAGFVGLRGDRVYALLPGSTSSTVVSFAHPAPGGGTNTAPTARLTVTPATGATTRTDIRFDASTSSDFEDAPGALRFRWDVDNDGVWDTPFSSDPALTRRFATAGTKLIRLQVRDSLALLGEASGSVNVAFEPDPGDPGPTNPPFELPFDVADAVFDPVRPYLYVSVKAAKRVYFVNLETGFIEKQFAFGMMPEMLALSPDGARLFTTLVAQEHTYSGGGPGAIAAFDLATQIMDLQFALTFDPRDVVVTSDGIVVVSTYAALGGSVWTFNGATGVQTGRTNDLYPRASLYLALHPSERIVYGADVGVSPDDLSRLDLQPGGAIAFRWDSPYHGGHRMGGRVWASPLRDVVITRGGDVFRVGTTAADDLQFVQSLSVGTITDLAFDAARRVMLSIEGKTLRYYNLESRFEMGSQALPLNGSFAGAHGDAVYALVPSTGKTSVLRFPHPAPEGGSNTAPVAGFTVTPPSGGTTLTTFRFDASTSQDDQDPLSALRFRWDFDNDGAWDTAFSSDPVVTKRFLVAGTKIIRVQVKDSLSLAAETTGSIAVAFEPDPGVPGPQNPAFELPFAATDVAIDSLRPYAYVSDKAGKKVYFVNLSTGFIEKQFAFDRAPEAVAMTPDGSRLFVALLTREHSYYWWNEDGHEGYIASFDLATQVMDRYYRIAEDPYDLAPTDDGRLVVSGGSGQWTFVRAFDAATGAAIGSAASSVYQGARLALHPSGTIVYGATTSLSPSDIFRMDLVPGGGVAWRWDSPYHGNHRMDGNVWPSPLGDTLVTRGGDVYTVGTTLANDMRYLRGLSQGPITAVAWDAARDFVVTLEGSALRRYRLSTGAPVFGTTIPATAAFMGRHGPALFSFMVTSPARTLLVREPVQNRPPVADMGGDVVAECAGPLGATVRLEASASRDPDSIAGTTDDIASYEWYESYGHPGQRKLGAGATLEAALSMGDHLLTLKVTDRSGAPGYSSRSVLVADTTPPVLDCGPAPATAECTGARRAYVEVHASAYDLCGDVIVSNDQTTSGADASDSYPLGRTTVGFAAVDAAGLRAFCTTDVAVADSIPPTLSVAAEPQLLWPPNHEMIPVGVTSQAHDACEPAPIVTLVSIVSSEPDDAPGLADGDTAVDIAGVAPGTGDGGVLLRAERAGTGQGRVYTLNYVAVDGSGNTTPAFGVVTVPHDQGSGPEPLLMRLEPNGLPGMVRIRWAGMPDAVGYDVIASDLAGVRIADGQVSLGPVRVLARGTTETSVDEGSDGDIPAPGTARMYLIQRRAAFGGGGYGSESAPWPRVPSSCDGGCP